jgi:hypothetical protein
VSAAGLVLALLREVALVHTGVSGPVAEAVDRGLMTIDVHAVCEDDAPSREQDGGQPPGAVLVDLAKALRVSTDQLRGLKPAKEKTSPRTARLLKYLQKIEDLPPADQRAVLKILDSLLERHGRNGHGRR